jgi:predicted metal-dependent hydrolase
MFDDPVLAASTSAGPTIAAPTIAAPTIEGPAPTSLPPAGPPSLQVEVIRSKKRTKTAQARLVGSTVEVRIPARCSREEERELVAHFTTKFERARSTDSIDLERRARRLADRHQLPRPTSIRWVDNQQSRWGSCTPSNGSIRLSSRLAEYPTWVLDYVIVHELAHLVVAGHDADFWRLVDAYPLTERARGFLIAKGLEGD